MLKQKLLWHLQRAELAEYRLLLSRQRFMFRGLPVEHVDIMGVMGLSFPSVENESTMSLCNREELACYSASVRERLGELGQLEFRRTCCFKYFQIMVNHRGLVRIN